MKDKKILEVNELDDSVLDNVAGGASRLPGGAHIVTGGQCPICGTHCFSNDEMTYISINGVWTRVCIQCAGDGK